MMTMMAGFTAILVGVIFLGFWWKPFITVIMATIPLVLLLGGALATYLGFEEWRDAQKMAKANQEPSEDTDVEKYKAEAEKYKSELDAMKQGEGAAAEAEEKPAEA